jgi:predicted RNA binding protein YcfA (HicA-like mRNA interferase family)
LIHGHSLANISGKEAVKAFLRAGWLREGQTGSHLMMTKDGQRATLTIPQHRELKPGTLRSIIRAANMTVDEFLDLLQYGI